MSPRHRLSWSNTLFLALVHLLAVAAVFYMVFVRFSWWTVGLAVLMFACCGLSITGGYHRLFAHASYRGHAILRFFYLVFGAASFQNSALKWASDHRRHHQLTDREEDPYSISKGFWWAHIGWILFKDGDKKVENVRDLERDPLVRFQDRHYVSLGLAAGLAFPALVASLWGDVIGAVLVAGSLRLFFQYHATFSVNSLAHLIGKKPFASDDSARDHFLTALVTLGEGYHNFHHRFPGDYRNGYRKFHFDPTKWWIWGMSRVGLVSNLRRISRDVIDSARRR